MEMQEARSGAVDDQTPDISVAAFADPKQGLLTTGRMLRRNKSQPRCHVARFAKLASVASCSNKCCRAERTDPRDREEPPHCLVAMRYRFDLFRQLGDPLLDVCEILQKIDLKEDRFGFEPEITAKVARLKCRIYEVGVSYAGRTYAEGKKIGFRDGLRAVWCVLKYNLFVRS